MKKILHSGIFLLAIGVAFAGTPKKPSATFNSFKQLNETGTPCHNTSGTVAECGGSGATCTITVSGISKTYYSDSDCGTLLKKN